MEFATILAPGALRSRHRGSFRQNDACGVLPCMKVRPVLGENTNVDQILTRTWRCPGERLADGLPEREPESPARLFRRHGVAPVRLRANFDSDQSIDWFPPVGGLHLEFDRAPGIAGRGSRT